MIIFSGQLSSKSKKYALLRFRKAGYVIGSMIATMLAIPTLIIASKTHWIFALFLIGYAMCPFLAKELIEKALPLPTQIIIDEKEARLIAEANDLSIEVPIEDVVSVLDRGECYHIQFDNQEDRFVCQKDLICKGSLHDFEELFKSKIIVANKE